MRGSRDEQTEKYLALGIVRAGWFGQIVALLFCLSVIHRLIYTNLHAGAYNAFQSKFNIALRIALRMRTLIALHMPICRACFVLEWGMGKYFILICTIASLIFYPVMSSD